MFPRPRQPGETGSRWLDTAGSADGRRVLIITGDVDAVTAPRLAAALRNARADGVAGLVLDLTEVGFFGCAGLEALVEADPWFGSITIVSGSRAVRRAFEATGLDGRFTLEPSRPIPLATTRAS